MIKTILKRISKIGNLVVAWFNFAVFFAMRPCWSGISKTLGYGNNQTWLLYNLPVLVCGLLLIIAITTTVFYIKSNKNKNLWSYIFNGINLAFLVVILVIIKLGAIDYLDYVWPNFFKYVGLAALLLLLIFFIFVYPKTSLHNNKIFKLSTLSIVLILLSGYLVNFTFNSIKTGAVVYAVENEYQIVFSSATKGRAWVEINGTRYFDNYNGSNRTNQKIHKVIIPMEILDEAKQYTIHVQKTNYRGPFGGYLGRDISEKYSFRPVDCSDGLNYYSISDIHMAKKASIKAYSYTQNNELLIVGGDIVSMMDTFYDANLVNEIVHEMTNGEIAVVYSRGNHEIKGKYAEQFHKFVGAKNESFYYSFYLDEIYGLVLDMGEDHDDYFWEYYDTAYFDEYRNKQIEFLRNEVNKKEYENYDYKLVVSHIPLVFINNRKDHKLVKETMTELLNQMDIDMVISGHQHDLFVFEPDTVKYNKDGKMVYNKDFTSKKTYAGLVTNHNFINILVSKGGYSQTDSSNKSSHIGMSTIVDFTNNTQTCIFNNSKHEKVNIVHPFANINYGNEIVFDLTTHKSVN